MKQSEKTRIEKYSTDKNENMQSGTLPKRLIQRKIRKICTKHKQCGKKDLFRDRRGLYFFEIYFFQNNTSL
jgi:hypothetical protein